MQTYTVYHLHSDYSLLDSCTKFLEYVDLAVEQGMTAIASTEHGKPSGWVEKKLYCQKKGIKFIHGVEIYLTETLEEKVRDNYHTVLLAKNYEGVMELNRLIEVATRPDHMYYVPRLSFDEFFSISPNIIKISACLASPLNKLPHCHALYERLIRTYDYLEIQHHPVPDQTAYNKHLFELSQRYKKPLIAGTDTHSASPYKAECRAILMDFKEQYYEGESAMDLTWKTYDELVEAYRQQDAIPRWAYMEAIENTNRMADSIVDFTLDQSPKYPLSCGSREADEQKLIEITWQMLEDKLAAGIIPKEQEAAFRRDIQEELDAFHKTNMSGFMLSMSEIISWCRQSGIPIGPNRGSVGGSRVAYVTDIIDLNPVTYQTVFSRFCNENRIELGDIDVDCIEADRPKIFEHIIEKFGAAYCARVASYGTIADLSFIDDCGGGLAIRYERVHHPEKLNDRGQFDRTKNSFDKANPFRPEKLVKIKASYKADAEKAKKDYPEMFQYFDGMVGTKVSQSVHPAGMVIACETLDDHWGVFHKDGERCLFINMDEAHNVMLVKYDLLILKTVEVIARCCQLAGLKYPRMHEINFNDAAVWKSICDDQSAIFQFESEFAAQSLAQFKPRNINDITMVTAAIRPSGASYRNDLLAHKKHRNPTKQIDEVLSNSLGYLVYQEQTIAFLQKVCGLSASYADTVRRAITKKQKDKVDAAMPDILNGYCNASDKPREQAEQEAKEFLQVIEDASAYSFGYNHAVGYSLLSYLCGYYRYYYTEEFIAAYLMTAANDDDLATGKAMAKRYGIHIARPKFRQDNRTFYIDKTRHEISDALSSMKGVGLKDAEALYALHDKEYRFFVDLLRDMTDTSGALNATVIKTLIMADYFSSFGTSGKLLSIYEQFTDGKNRYTKTLAPATVEKRMIALRTFERDAPEEEIHLLDLIPFEVEKFGTPIHRCEEKDLYAVLDVDTKYSPKVRLCSLCTGNVGIMKVLKATYHRRPFVTGNVIRITAWQKKPAYEYMDGKPKPKQGVTELWLSDYTILQKGSTL